MIRLCRKILAGGLLLSLVLSVGCGQKKQEEATEPPQIEENSLAVWETSLEEGHPRELSAEGIRGVSVVGEGTPLFAVSYEPRAYKNSFDCWAVSVPYQSMAVVDTEAMYAYFHILADMELTPAGDVTREQAGLTDCGNTVYAAYYKEQTPEGGQAAPDRGICYRFGNRTGEGDRYVEAGGEIWVADAEVVEKIFSVNPYDCILKVVSVVKMETVSGVDVTFAGQSFEMEISEGKFRLDGKEMDSGDFYDLYTGLMSIFIEKELPEGGGVKGERELLMTVTYHRNMAQAPEIRQCYYRYDENYASVQVNGTEFFLVSREALEEIQMLFKNL